MQTEVDPEPAAFGGTLDPCIHNAPVPGVALLAARRRYISRAQLNRPVASPHVVGFELSRGIHQ